MKINSIRFKISILFSGFLFVVLVSFGVFEFYTIRKILYEEEKEELKVKIEHLDNFIDAYAAVASNGHSLMHELFTLNGEINRGRNIVDQLWQKDSLSLGLQNDYYRILNLKGRVLLNSENMTNEIEQTFNAQFSNLTTKQVFMILQLNRSAFYGVNSLIAYADRSPLILQLATPLKSTEKILAKQKDSIIGGIVAIVFMTIFMGTLLTRRILKSVSDVTHVANEISQTNLSQRVSLKEIDQEMEQLVGSFNCMINRLEKSFAYINEFNSHIAHELKTPLAIIKGELELAIGSGNTKEENERVLTDSLQEVNRLIKIIKDLLLLAKFEYKAGIFKMEKMDITELLKDIYQHSKVLTTGKNINLELVSSNQPIQIKGDGTHLRRVFLNLIHNAIKFTPDGGQIKIFTEVSKEQVYISIQDTGIGIPLTEQPKVFEKFFRIRQIKQEELEGNGLGLSMARAIARAHSGDITFESEINKGSTFKVSLPLLSV